MALLFYEGFDNWIGGTFTTQYSGQYGVNQISSWIMATSMTAGTLGGQAISCGNTGYITYYTNAAQTGTLVHGFRVNFTVGTNNQIMSWCDTAPGSGIVPTAPGSIQCGLSTNASGKLIFWRGTNANILGTGTTTLVSLTDNYIEVKFNVASTGANVTVRLNGVNEIVLTNQNTQNTANANWMGWSTAQTPGGTTYKYDDMYLLDTSGPAPLNDFLGIVRVETLFPSANSSVTWTPNASTNVSRVQETTMDSDTTYNATATLNNVDLFTHGSLGSTPNTIFCGKVQSFVRKEDVAIHTVRTKLVSGATTANGTSRGITTIYQAQEDYYPTDPNTALAWTGANVNGTTIGYELVS